MFYYRPRMYLFTYAFDSDDTRELYGEYHLGRQALRFVLLVMSIPYSKEVTWNVFLINKVRYVFWLNIVICRQHVGAGLWDDRLQQGFVKGEVFCFRYPYFHFGHGESTSTASHQTSTMKITLLENFLYYRIKQSIAGPIINGHQGPLYYEDLKSSLSTSTPFPTLSYDLVTSEAFNKPDQFRSLSRNCKTPIRAPEKMFNICNTIINLPAISLVWKLIKFSVNSFKFLHL